MFGLKDSIVQSICNVFESFAEIEKAKIYGSRAKGNYKPGSDIDICIFGNLLNTTIVNKISLQLDDLMLPYTFDLTIYGQISNPQLIEHIDRVGCLFYNKEE